MIILNNYNDIKGVEHIIKDLQKNVGFISVFYEPDKNCLNDQFFGNYGEGVFIINMKSGVSITREELTDLVKEKMARKEKHMKRLNENIKPSDMDELLSSTILSSDAKVNINREGRKLVESFVKKLNKDLTFYEIKVSWADIESPKVGLIVKKYEIGEANKSPEKSEEKKKIVDTMFPKVKEKIEEYKKGLK